MEKQRNWKRSWIRKFRRLPQALCSNLEQLVTKLDSNHATIIQNGKSDISTDWLTNLSENQDYHQGLLKQYRQTADSGNQTSLVSSTSADDKDPTRP